MPRRRDLEATDNPHPLHDQVFGSDPDGLFNDTPEGAIGENVNIPEIGAEAGRNMPLRGVGDTDQTDRQPLGQRRH